MIYETVLLSVFLLSVFLYYPLNARKSKYFFETPFDHFIPLLPCFVISYLAFFPFVAGTVIFSLGKVIFTELLMALIIANITAAIFWYFIPNGMRRPYLKGKDLFTKLLKWVYKHDNVTNAFPSGHVYYSLICGFYLWQSLSQIGWLFFAFGGLIAISTVFVKQHWVGDIGGGMLWTIGAIFVAKMIVGG